jgi:hypothetical protein
MASETTCCSPVTVKSLVGKTRYPAGKASANWLIAGCMATVRRGDKKNDGAKAILLPPVTTVSRRSRLIPGEEKPMHLRLRGRSNADMAESWG